MGPNHTYQHEHGAKRPPDVDLQFRMEFIFGQVCSVSRGRREAPGWFKVAKRPY
jgi:hypothetical protein